MSIERAKAEVVVTTENSEFVEKLNTTVEAFSTLNAVEGIHPELMVVCYQGEDGSASLYLPAEPAMLWFRAKHPKGRLEQTIVKLNDSQVIMEGKVFDEEGHMLANAFVTRYRTDDEYGKNYIQNAGTSAVRKALGNCGFGTPLNSQYIEGVTKIQDCTSAPVDAGVAIAPPPPPLPKVVQKQNAPQRAPQNQARQSKEKKQEQADDGIMVPETSQESVPAMEDEQRETAKVAKPAPAVPAPPVVRTEKKVMSLEDALAFTIEVGRCKGKSFKDLIEGKDYSSIRFFLRDSYANTEIQKAAQMIAGQYAL